MYYHGVSLIISTPPEKTANLEREGRPRPAAPPPHNNYYGITTIMIITSTNQKTDMILYSSNYI